MRLPVRILFGIVAIGFVALVVRGLTRVTVCPPSIDSSAIAIGVVKRGLLPHDLFGAAIPSDLQNGLYVQRPIRARAHSSKGLFKISPDGEEFVYVDVKFGWASVDRIQIASGLLEGDRIIVSDMSAWEQYDRVRLK